MKNINLFSIDYILQIILALARRISRQSKSTSPSSPSTRLRLAGQCVVQTQLYNSNYDCYITNTPEFIHKTKYFKFLYLFCRHFFFENINMFISAQNNVLIKSTLDNSPPPLLNLKLLRPQGQIIYVKFKKIAINQLFNFFFSVII